MRKMIDIKNQRFGKLKAIEPSVKVATNKSKKWICECDCGTVKEIRSSDLRLGKIVSCGCERDRKIKERSYKHGMSNTKIYDVWQSMKGRCYRETCKDYPNYGGRGIKIDKNWLGDFMVFYNWAISEGYKEGLTIDRINPNGNYEPGNCKWLPNEKQALNRRNTITHMYEGKELNTRELSEELNINYNTLRNYLGKGRTIEEILENI
ncbi:hypothetical protein [Tissierella creatinophila]|uniref:Uncharacterized protein n=1 Tax=Tissierella creatinophila DSM 6911 TaxID=1123403 RepID=A0A1U7M6F4_TISCR|nr:hypothetical protein [Tissierella creatinophila]OLS02902.1 hypothetical protein TICRE_10560 [Tissierella creatinophila DSM 6911]